MKNEEDPEFVARLCAEILRELEVERPMSADVVILYSHLDSKKVRKYLRILTQRDSKKRLSSKVKRSIELHQPELLSWRI